LCPQLGNNSPIVTLLDRPITVITIGLPFGDIFHLLTHEYMVTFYTFTLHVSVKLKEVHYNPYRIFCLYLLGALISIGEKEDETEEGG
jgi:hypothetical protein